MTKKLLYVGLTALVMFGFAATGAFAGHDDESHQKSRKASQHHHEFKRPSLNKKVKALQDQINGLLALKDQISGLQSQIDGLQTLQDQISGLQDQIDGLQTQIGELGTTSGICSGNTTPGVWEDLQNQNVVIYVEVDTSFCGFTATPLYFTSLGGVTHHFATTGATSIYSPTATGFTVYVRFDNQASGVYTDAVANNWFISWIAVGD